MWTLNRPLKAGPIDIGHRMTVIRLNSGGLWVHSPVSLDVEVRAALDKLGPIECFVSPSTFHDLYWPDWFAAYPQANFHAAPGVHQEHPELPFTNELGGSAPDAWSGQLEQVILGGMPRINETVFLHPQSKTLIVTDMAFNHGRGVNWATGLALRMNGCHGRFGVSRLYKIFMKDKRALRRSVDAVLDWDFERIVLGHGSVVEKDSQEILKEAYSFLWPG
ncbi:MAG: DUF4336 domain-containing protein [Verrucomicrobiota bacterium]